MDLMSQEYDPKFATAAAAAVFAIHKLQGTGSQYQRKTRESPEPSKTKMTSKKEDNTIAARVNRRSSIKDSKIYAGDASMSKGMVEGAPRGRKPSQPSLVSTAVNYPTRRGGVDGKADAWLKAEIEKIRKWNEKMKSTILSWESDEKMRAKRHMERKKAELEKGKVRNMQRYEKKLAKIENLGGGAIMEMEETTRSKESDVKDKAKKMRARGKLPDPPYCFCF